MNSVSNFRKAMHDIAARKGDFTLFGLFKPADAPLMRSDEPGTWDLVAAAPWLDTGLKGIGELLNLLQESIGARHTKQLSRVAPVSRDNPGVRDILKHFPVEDGERWVFGVELFGREMERAVIFRAWPQKRKRTPRPKLEHATAGTVRRRA